MFLFSICLLCVGSAQILNNLCIELVSRLQKFCIKAHTNTHTQTLVSNYVSDEWNIFVEESPFGHGT